MFVRQKRGKIYFILFWERLLLARILFRVERLWARLMARNCFSVWFLSLHSTEISDLFRNSTESAFPTLSSTQRSTRICIPFFSLLSRFYPRLELPINAVENQMDSWDIVDVFDAESERYLSLWGTFCIRNGNNRDLIPTINSHWKLFSFSTTFFHWYEMAIKLFFPPTDKEYLFSLLLTTLHDLLATEKWS